MTFSSIKKIWWISHLYLSFVNSASVKSQFEARVSHTETQFTSHRHRIFLEASDVVGSFNMVGSIRAQAEGFIGNESSILDLRDLYLGMRTPKLNAKLGWQEVVWGEAFGFYFADIINPKDHSELGLGDLSGNRLTIPMLNLKTIVSGFSAQLVLIPYPMISRIAPHSSPFAFPFQKVFGATPVFLKTQRAPEPEIGNMEIGTRISFTAGNTSIAAFHFTGLDRNPPYQSTLGSTVIVHRPFFRISSSGISTSSELMSAILRGEFVVHHNRGHQVVLPGSLTYENSPEEIGVIGFDYPLNNWQLGLQTSLTHRTKDILGAGPQTKEQLSLRLAGTTVRDIDWEFIGSYLFHDGSMLLQPRFDFPFSSQLVFALGAQIFLGGSDSDFGGFREASRINAELRAHL